MIRLTLRTPDNVNLFGFFHFWGMYVIGFDRTQHCLACLRGTRSKHITRHMEPILAPLAMNEAADFDFLYLCGVSRSWPTNFHMVLMPEEGGKAEATTYNGIRIAAQGAVQMAIPPLPDGFQGLSKAFTTCRNYQFGHAFYASGQPMWDDMETIPAGALAAAR